MLAVSEELYPLGDVDSVAEPDAACLHCHVDVVNQVVSRLSSVVDLLQMAQVRVLRKDSINDWIISLKRVVFFFLLNKVKTNQLTPVCLAGSFEVILVVLIPEHLEAYEDESEGKMRVQFIQVVDYGINGTHELLYSVLLH